MPDVLVVGELNADLILNELESAPALGKEVLARQMTLTMGSSSAIFACNLSSMGVPVRFAGKLGQDMLARLILDSLSERGVDTRYIMQSNHWQTGVSVATCTADDRTMVTYPGAMEELTEADITDEMLQSASHLHLSSIFLQPGLRPGIVRLFSRAKALGMTTSLDPQFDPAEKWDLPLAELLPLVDVFLPNRSEIQGFSRKFELHEAIRDIAPMANYLVVKDGDKGAWMQFGDELHFHQAFRNEQVADVIGAGDSFDAGFIARFIRGEQPRECLRFATLMGALNTTGAGGTAAFAGGMGAIRERAAALFKVDLETVMP